MKKISIEQLTTAPIITQKIKSHCKFTQIFGFTLIWSIGVLSTGFVNPLFAHEKPRGLKLTGSVSANTIYQTTTYYNWSLSKSFHPNQTPFMIRPGKTVPATFTISLRRSNGYVGEGVGPVTGQVCLTNSDTQPTQSLKITTTIQAQGPGGFQDVATQEIPLQGELERGQSRCFFFIYNNLIINRTQNYRVLASVSSQNSRQLLAKPTEILLTTPLKIQNQNNSLDESAILKDIFECPTGFLCSPIESTQTYWGPRTLSYQVTLTNQSAPCGQTLIAKNTAILTGITSQYSQTASVSMRIFTGKCTP